MSTASPDETRSVKAEDGYATTGPTTAERTPDGRSAGDSGSATAELPSSAVLGAAQASPRPAVAADVPPVSVAEQAPADDIVVPVIAEQNRALGQPDGVDWDSVVAVAEGPLLGSIEASVLEYSELGWKQVGIPRLVSSTVLDLAQEPQPPTARIEVCLDFAEVDVIDATGASLVDQTAETRVRSILTVVYVEGRWIAKAQDFTDDLSC